MPVKKFLYIYIYIYIWIPSRILPCRKREIEQVIRTNLIKVSATPSNFEQNHYRSDEDRLEPWVRYYLSGGQRKKLESMGGESAWPHVLPYFIAMYLA